MNKEVNLSITTLKIEIRTLVLDGKRFTKSVFDQLPTAEYLDLINETGDISEDSFVEPNYVGWVKMKNDWLLFEVDGCLYKTCSDNWRFDDSVEGIDLMDSKPYAMHGSKAAKEIESKMRSAVYNKYRPWGPKQQIFISI